MVYVDVRNVKLILYVKLIFKSKIGKTGLRRPIFSSRTISYGLRRPHVKTTENIQLVYVDHVYNLWQKVYVDQVVDVDLLPISCEMGGLRRPFDIFVKVDGLRKRLWQFRAKCVIYVDLLTISCKIGCLRRPFGNFVQNGWST